MNCSRRRFLQNSALFTLGTGLACGRTQSPWNGFRYAMCNESMQGMAWEEQCRLVAEAGFSGIEIAPFTLVKEGVEELTPVLRRDMVRTMRDHGLSCTGLHWLLVAPPAGLHCTADDAAVRRRTWDYVHRLIDFCSDLGGPVMVFGSPKQRSAGDAGISVAEAVQRLTEGLSGCAEHAGKNRVKILLEPLDRSQTDVVNTLAQALEVVNAIQHPAIQTMFDFHNTPDETEPLEVLVKMYYPYIHHVHVQEMNGKHLGTGNAAKDFVAAFQTLKDLRYNQWVSLEVFDFTPGAKTIAEESMRVLRQLESSLS
ncbi:MAG TPA: sugar phosphate isomerase/epimerase family protein [bacterium]|nr:sugar phosphate isomerase/epimerase family protein [bacterium]